VGFFNSMKVFYAAIAFLVVGVLLASAVTAYTVEGGCVYHETQYYKIEQCPAVLNDLSNYVNLSVTNKHSQPHDLMLGFGFDTDVVKPKQAWRWGSAPHQVPTYDWVSRSYTCDGEFNYSLDPKYFWCYHQNGTKKFEHSFVNGWVQNKTAEWFEWRQNGWETQWWNDWIDVSSVFTKQSFQGKDWYYAPQNISFAAHETKVLRALIQAKPNTQGKYDLFAWRGEWTPQQAWNDPQKSVLLDPWWNASFEYCRDLNLNETINAARSYEAVELEIDSSGWVHKPYNNSLRVVNASCGNDGTVQPADFYNPDYNGTYYDGVTLVFMANATAGQNQTWSVYYSGSDKGAPAFTDEVVVTNGSYVEVLGDNINYTVEYSAGAVTSFRSRYGDDANKCLTNGCLLRKEAAGWMFRGGEADDECDVIFDGDVSAVVRCVAGENGNTARYDTIYSHSYYIKSFQAIGGNYYITNEIQSGLQNNTFYNRTGALTTITENGKNYVISKLLNGFFDTGENAALTICKDRTVTHNVSLFDSVGAAGRTDLGTNNAANHYNFTSNLSMRFGFEPRAAAETSSGDVVAFYDKAQFPLLLALGAENAFGFNKPINLTVLTPAGAAVSNWSVNLSNATVSFVYNNKTDSLVLDETQAPDGTVTVHIWRAGYVPYYNSTVEINASAFTLNMSVTLQPANSTLNLSVHYANGTALDGWSVNLSNATNSTQFLAQNTPLVLDETLLPNGTITVRVWRAGFGDYSNASVVVYGDEFLLNMTVVLYPRQYFYLNDTGGGGLIQSWNISLWNGTYYYNGSTTNYLFNVSVDNLPLGVVNSTAVALGAVGNTSSFTITNTSFWNITFATYASRFMVTCLDADTGAALANCGIRVENASTFNSSLGNYNESVGNTPTGSLTVSANKTGFASSVYYVSWDGSANYNVNAYLMNLSNPYAIYVRFHVRNVYNVPLENAFVNVTRMIGGSPAVVGQCYTDAAGDCAFYLSSAASYTIVTSLSGYYANTVSITPSSNDYTITLSSSAVSGNYTLTNIFEDLRWGLFPNPRGLTNVSTNFSLIAVSDNCSLAYWGFNLSCNGSLITSQNTSTASCGGTLYYFANLTNCNGTQVTANYWFSRNPFILGEAIFSWYLDAAEVEKTFTQWREDYADSGAGTIVFAIIALLVALFVGAWVARVNRAGAVIAIIAVLALALAANWLGDYGWVILTFTVIFVGAALFLRERVA